MHLVFISSLLERRRRNTDRKRVLGSGIFQGLKQFKIILQSYYKTKWRKMQEINDLLIERQMIFCSRIDENELLEEDEILSRQRQQLRKKQALACQEVEYKIEEVDDDTI